MKPSTLTLSLDLGILGEQSAEVTFYYRPGITGTLDSPPEPEHVKIVEVTIAHPGYAYPITLLPFIADLGPLEQCVLERFRDLAESAATDAAIDRWEERQRHEID